MVNLITMHAGGGVCVHCGKIRLKEGDKCLEVSTARGTGYIALECKDLHPWTKGFVVPPQA